MAALALWAAGAACTRNPYVIGAICPEGIAGPSCADGGGGAGGSGFDAGTSVTFAVGLNQSGVDKLEPELTVPPAGPLVAALRLRGESATAAGWPGERGGAFVRAGAPAPAPTLGLEGPFTDLTRAVGLAADAPTYVASPTTTVALGADDLAVEIVLRAAAGATIIEKRAGGVGWSLAADAAGVHALELDDGTPAHHARVPSEPLAAGAWYHCLFWVSRAAGARADCDGRPGAAVTVDVSALGVVDAAATASLGGGGAATRVALLAVYRAAPGGLGPAAGWLDVGRRRFAALTGALPSFAGGTALPKPGLRPTTAFVDLQAAPGEVRHLHLVGPDWPRVACRTDSDNVRACGFLVEPERTRFLAVDPRAWQAGEVAVAPGGAVFADGEPRLVGLVPSTTAGPHSIFFTVNAGAANQVFSFFARGGGTKFVGASVGLAGRAVFDLANGRVFQAPLGVGASIEAWGDGLFRCSYAFVAPQGPSTYAIGLLLDPQTPAFIGDGATVSVLVAAPQVDVGRAFASLPAAEAMQAADHLTFVADDGNLPRMPAVALSFRALLPPGARLTDQALLNLNLAGSFTEQIQVYVIGMTGLVKFWGLGGGATYWQFDNPVSPTDGRLHMFTASWSSASARLLVDGTFAGQSAQAPNGPPTGLDRIDVGFSGKSSGALEGLIGNLEISAR